MSFRVPAYEPPALRRFTCQRYGHVATVCRGKQRCGRCEGADGECGITQQLNAVMVEEITQQHMEAAE